MRIKAILDETEFLSKVKVANTKTEEMSELFQELSVIVRKTIECDIPEGNVLLRGVLAATHSKLTEANKEPKKAIDMANGIYRGLQDFLNEAK